MIKVKYFILAKSVLVDQITKQVTISNIIDDINATQYPATLHESFVVALLERDPSKDANLHDVNLNIFLNGKDLGGADYTVDFKEQKRNRSIISLPGLSLHEPGKIVFDLVIGGKKSVSMELDVLLKPKDNVKIPTV